MSCKIKRETSYRGFSLRAAGHWAALGGTGSVLEQWGLWAGRALAAGVERTRVLLALRPQVAPQRCVAVMNALGSGSFFLASTSGLAPCE